MNITPLLDHFNAYRPLNLDEKEALISRVKERRIKRRQFILQENEICQHLTFVLSGCFKMYGVDAKGKEHNLQFAAENDWIVDFASLYREKPSKLYIEAMEPSLILQIYRDDLYFLYENHPIFNKNFRIIVENKYIELQNRVLQNISSTSQERYEAFLEQYPVLPKTILYPIQSSLPWEILGAIPEMFQTVYGSLHLALNIQAGETLLIRGGTSSIGMLATQMAKHQGLNIIATTRNPAKTRALIENGATHTLIDDGHLKDKVRALFPRGVDKVLELVGAETLQDSLQCAKVGGVVCMTGMLSEKWSIPDFAPMEFIPASVYLTVFDSGQMRCATQSFQEFIQLVEDGTIKLNVDKIFSLDQIVAAHQYMESNRATGKIVVLT